MFPPSPMITKTIDSIPFKSMELFILCGLHLLCFLEASILFADFGCSLAFSTLFKEPSICQRVMLLTQRVPAAELFHSRTYSFCFKALTIENPLSLSLYCLQIIAQRHFLSFGKLKDTSLLSSSSC